MKERPILFSSEMVKAILDGRKTQTRRVVKPQPEQGLTIGNISCNGMQEEWFLCDKDGDEIPDSIINCPYGQPSDRLWVRETWDVYSSESDNQPSGPPVVTYKADGGYSATRPGRWRSPIFMPRTMSRITFEITAVRVERLQDISEENAKAEGCGGYVGGEGPVNECVLAVEPGYLHQRFFRDGFSFLWDSLNAKRGYGWDANPFVWVISFRRIT
ncbi:MAG: hypothetical protein IMZ54_07765 [Acidobacteria bacterium]|nr:hypothetical protein [Acidobacteriota bacterium]